MEFDFYYERNFHMCAQLLSTQPYKGTRDFYPEDMQLRNWFFGKISESLRLASFEEYNAPMLESLEIYIAKSGHIMRLKKGANAEKLSKNKSSITKVIIDAKALMKKESLILVSKRT